MPASNRDPAPPPGGKAIFRSLVFISVAAGFSHAALPWDAISCAGSEHSFLGGLPQYRLVRGLAQIENVEDLKPVLVNVEEGGPCADLTFEKER
jgi:hypothetical protein